MPVLICLRKELWTGLISVGDQVPTCPVFTRAKIKSHFGILVNSPSQYLQNVFTNHIFNIYVKRRIWHWITDNGWYAIKRNQINQPNHFHRLYELSSLLLFVAMFSSKSVMQCHTFILSDHFSALFFPSTQHKRVHASQNLFLKLLPVSDFIKRGLRKHLRTLHTQKGNIFIQKFK